HYQDRISLSDIAASASISDRECLRCFQNNLGTTPFTFLLRYRCRVAADRLKRSADPVTEIAYGCGFSSPSYFGKIFRQEMGWSPSDYRKKCN
ncbi:MAG: AraC family transcriptional regulator, partial [Lachnospiraceae bacterium]|nr:AraC family transcriptional regulator [Lachnospiraceae bacterium]